MDLVPAPVDVTILIATIPVESLATAMSLVRFARSGASYVAHIRNVRRLVPNLALLAQSHAEPVVRIKALVRCHVLCPATSFRALVAVID